MSSDGVELENHKFNSLWGTLRIKKFSIWCWMMIWNPKIIKVLSTMWIIGICCIYSEVMVQNAGLSSVVSDENIWNSWVLWASLISDDGVELRICEFVSWCRHFDFDSLVRPISLRTVFSQLYLCFYVCVGWPFFRNAKPGRLLQTAIMTR